MPEPISPPPVKESDRGHLPAYVSNGVIGLRIRDLPLFSGTAIVSGLSGRDPVAQIEAAAHAPYPLAGDLKVGRVWLSDAPNLARFVEQTYDFSCGELHTRFVFSVDEAHAQVDVLTFASRSQPTLVLQEVTVELSRACDVVLRAIVDPRGVQGDWVSRHTETPGEPKAVVDGSLGWRTLGDFSTCGIAYATDLLGSDEVKRSKAEWGEQSPLATEYAFRARAGRRYRLRQIASLVPSQLHRQPDREATRLAALGRKLGFDTLREENRAAWAELWKGRINLVGASREWQQLADAAFFYLNASVHYSAPSSTSIFGLAEWYDYNYYYGHIMWDLETFCLPALLLLQPEAARALLDFRTRSLPAARANARLSGQRGVRFPWEASMSTGEEAAPGAGSASWFEDHVTLDVALGFARYVHATGDEWFLRDQAWPVLHGVAEWLTSRVARSKRGYEILRGMGIAERKEPADNVAYTNMAAKVVLGEAIRFADRLGYAAPPLWSDIRERLVVPMDRRRGVIVSHDGYRQAEEKGATPSPLAGLFPSWYEVPEDVERATLDFYLSLAPEYIGSPMLSSLYGVWAAWRGDRELAAKLLEEGYAQFVDGHFFQTLEYRPDRFPEQPEAGPFFANLGGFLLGLLYGFPGVRPGEGRPETWPCRPVVLPAGWRAIEVERIWVRGERASLVARHGQDRARIELEQAAPVERRAPASDIAA